MDQERNGLERAEGMTEMGARGLVTEGDGDTHTGRKRDEPEESQRPRGDKESRAAGCEQGRGWGGGRKTGDRAGVLRIKRKVKKSDLASPRWRQS